MTQDGVTFGGWVGLQAGLQCPQDADAVDEGIDLEMDTKAKENGSEADVFHFDGPEQCHDHDAKQTLTAPSCADRCNHWV